MHHKTITLIFLIFLFAISGCSTSREDKNIQIANSSINQILEKDILPTFSPLESDISTSSDGSKIIFIRDVGDHRASEDFAEGTDIFNQIVQKNLNNDEEEIIFNSGKISDFQISNLPKYYPLNKIYNIRSLLLSSDNKKAYFETSAWVTSDAIFSIDLQTKKLNYITDGSLVEIISSGEFKNNIIVNQRHYQEGGSVLYCDYIVNFNSGKRIKDLKKCL
jgi:hypothetical protein